MNQTTIFTIQLYILGLITGPALKMFSPRQVAIVGSLLTSLGLVLSSASTKLWQITVAYGLLVGTLNEIPIRNFLFKIAQHLTI